MSNEGPTTTPVDSLAATILRRAEALSSEAETLARNPDSTIEPPEQDSEERARALEAWEALAAFRLETARGLSFERTLGEGGMGVVHLAEQRTLGRKVAVKTLRGALRDDEASLKLLREAWITGSLEHPNVVPVYDVGVDDAGGPLIVMKRIEGVEWASVLHDPEVIAARFGATDALEWNLRILAQVCNAIHFAHARGVIHRDLKPSNVMIGGFGEVYLLDWGIAVALKDDGTGRFPLAAHAGDTAGTPLYMAPEMLRGDPLRLSERTDVYLLGAVLFEVVAGKPPHDGASMAAIFASIARSEPMLPTEVPVELASIVRRAMARDPDDRYASADEVRQAIEWYLRHRGSMRLSDDAGRSLARLRDAIAASEHRRVLYNLLGECRFGYRAALVESKENDRARDGLRAAVLAVAEWELEQGEPESAAVLVDEIDDASRDLLDRIEAARRAKEAERSRVAQLETLGRDLDKGPGARTRVFIMTVLGVTWIAMPLIRLRSESSAYASNDLTLAISVGLLAISFGLGIWARESMLKTAINRRLYASLLFAFVAQIVLTIGLRFSGVEPSTAHWLHVLIWFLIIGSIVIHVERGLAPAAFVTGVIFLLAAKYPAWLYPLMALTNAFFLANVIVLWMPRRERR